MKSAVAAILKNKDHLMSIAQAELRRSPQDILLEWNWVEQYLESFIEDKVALEGIPRGKTVVLGSMVWPIFYTLQFVLSSVRAQNPVTVKPSEQAKKTVGEVIRILKASSSKFALLECEFGDQEVGRQLSLRPEVRTVIFQGSYEAGLRVTQDSLSQPWKQVLLFQSAKNPAVVLEDADPLVPEELLRDCFTDLGQNCLSTSLIFVPEQRLIDFQNEFLKRMKGVQAGVIIDSAMGDRYQKMIAVADREGAMIVARGAIGPLTPTLAIYPKQTPEQIRRSTLFHFEVLAPLIVVIPYAAQPELPGLLGALSFGHSISFWGKDLSFVKSIQGSLEFGRVLTNQSVYESDPWQSFNAKKRSGNHAVLGKGLIPLLRTY